MISSNHMFWDSCVFIRYLTNTPTDHVDDIERLINDARSGLSRIYYSSICFTEIRPRFLRHKGFGSAHDFFSSLGPSCEPIDPNPNILADAGELRDADPVNPSDPSPNTRKRVIGTADAIHLTTCLYLRDVMNVPDVVFHTFDEGKGTTWEGRCIPLLGFERWFPPNARTPKVEDVCRLPRAKPLHPQLSLLPRGSFDAPAIITEIRH